MRVRSRQDDPMTLFRQAAAAVANYQHEPKVWEVSIAEQRAAARLQAAREPKEEVSKVEDLDVDGVPCRLYKPRDAVWPGVNGLILHLHGGGFVFNDVEVHDAVCRRFANRAGLAV